MKLTIEHLKKLIRKELQKIDEVRDSKEMRDSQKSKGKEK